MVVVSRNFCDEQCHHHGDCISSGANLAEECECYNGYTGSTCEFFENFNDYFEDQDDTVEDEKNQEENEDSGRNQGKENFFNPDGTKNNSINLLSRADEIVNVNGVVSYVTEVEGALTTDKPIEDDGNIQPMEFNHVTPENSFGEVKRRSNVGIEGRLSKTKTSYTSEFEHILNKDKFDEVKSNRISKSGEPAQFTPRKMSIPKRRISNFLPRTYVGYRKELDSEEKMSSLAPTMSPPTSDSLYRDGSDIVERNLVVKDDANSGYGVLMASLLIGGIIVLATIILVVVWFGWKGIKNRGKKSTAAPINLIEL